MRIVKYLSIFSTLILFVLIGFISKSFAGVPTYTSSDFLFTEPIIAEENENIIFTQDDQELLNEYEVYSAAQDMFDPSKLLVLTGARVVIKVSVAKQRMQVFVGGVKKYDWPTTTGSAARYGRRAITPKGTYTPYDMTVSHKSRKYGWTLPYSIKVIGGYFIHAIKSTGGLGKPLSKTNGSHGCIRLSLANARTLFNLVKQYGRTKTQVVIY